MELQNYAQLGIHTKQRHGEPNTNPPVTLPSCWKAVNENIEKIDSITKSMVTFYELEFLGTMYNNSNNFS
jgi:hypothetical protein